LRTLLIATTMIAITAVLVQLGPNAVGIAFNLAIIALFAYFAWVRRWWRRPEDGDDSDA
jgi:hypothetical protein